MCYISCLMEQSFKNRLVEELSYHGLSYKEFAQRVGISLNTLNMYLYRNSIPAADVAVRMAQVLNTTTEYLVLGTAGHATAEWASSNRCKTEILSLLDTFSPVQLSCFLDITRAYKSAFSDTAPSSAKSPL